MRRAEQLITQMRRGTENERVPGTSGTADGISDEDFLQALNAGQERIESMIIKTFEKVFAKTKVFSVQKGIADIPMPKDIFTVHHVILAEFTTTGQERDYYILDRIKPIERRSFEGTPTGYCPFSNTIILSPIPDTSIGTSLRLTYNEKKPRIDKRRALVDTAVLDTGARTITSLTLSTTSDITFDPAEFTEQDYICINDRDGNILMEGIPINSVDSSGVVTVAPGFVYQVGETIPGGSYVVLGDRSTTTSKLPDTCEKYLLAYGEWKIFKRDSSSDASEALAELQMMEQDIVDSFALISGDVDQIPIVNLDYLW